MIPDPEPSCLLIKFFSKNQQERRKIEQENRIKKTSSDFSSEGAATLKTDVAKMHIIDTQSYFSPKIKGGEKSNKKNRNKNIDSSSEGAATLKSNVADGQKQINCPSLPNFKNILKNDVSDGQNRKLHRPSQNFENFTTRGIQNSHATPSFGGITTTDMSSAHKYFDDDADDQQEAASQENDYSSIFNDDDHFAAAASIGGTANTTTTSPAPSYDQEAAFQAHDHFSTFQE